MSFIRRYIFSVDHKVIARQYLFLGLLFHSIQVDILKVYELSHNYFLDQCFVSFLYY